MVVYSNRGCAAFLATYLLSYIEDSAACIVGQGSACNEEQIAALEYITAGAAGKHRDDLVAAVAGSVGRSPQKIFQGLLGQAQAQAKKGRRAKFVRPSWTYEQYKKVS